MSFSPVREQTLDFEARLTRAALDEYDELRPPVWTGKDVESFLQVLHVLFWVLVVVAVIAFFGGGGLLDFWNGTSFHLAELGISVAALALLAARAVWIHIPYWKERRQALATVARYMLEFDGILVMHGDGEREGWPWSQLEGFYAGVGVTVCFPRGEGKAVLIPVQELDEGRRVQVQSLLKANIPEFLTRAECLRGRTTE